MRLCTSSSHWAALDVHNHSYRSLFCDSLFFHFFFGVPAGSRCTGSGARRMGWYGRTDYLGGKWTVVTRASTVQTDALEWLMLPLDVFSS